MSIVFSSSPQLLLTNGKVLIPRNQLITVIASLNVEPALRATLVNSRYSSPVDAQSAVKISTTSVGTVKFQWILDYIYKTDVVLPDGPNEALRTQINLSKLSPLGSLVPSSGYACLLVTFQFTIGNQTGDFYLKSAVTVSGLDHTILFSSVDTSTVELKSLSSNILGRAITFDIGKQIIGIVV